MSSRLTRRSFVRSGGLLLLGGGIGMSLAAACGPTTPTAAPATSVPATAANPAATSAPAAAATAPAAAPTAAPGTKQTVEIVYNTFLDPANANDPRAAQQTALIDRFQKANPGITVKVNLDPTNQNVPRTIATRSATPDVFRVTSDTLGQQVAQRGLEPIDKYIDRDKLDKNDWLLPFSLNQVKGESFSLQQDYRIPILFYRKSLLAKASVQPPKTFAEVSDVGSRLSTPQVWGYALALGSNGLPFAGHSLLEFLVSSVVGAYGGKYFADDGREIAFQREDLLRAATIVKDLFASKAVPLAAVQAGTTEVHDGLRAGTIAMATYALYRYKTVQTQGAGDDLAWSPPPGVTADSPQTVYGYTLAINSNSARKDAAWQFISFMTSPESEATMARGGEVVARKSGYNDAFFSTPDAKDQKDWSDLVLKRGRPVSFSNYYSQFGELTSAAFSRMILENGTAEAATDEVLAGYADVLKKNP